jgi:hypothetical protein
MLLRRLAVVVITLISTLSFAQSAPPTADTYSNYGAPTTNYGAATFFNVAGCCNSYVKFSLATLPSGASIKKATLRLYMDGLGEELVSLNVYQLNNSWSESTLTYNNAPPWESWWRDRFPSTGSSISSC